ncbi:hypothetical protein WR25_03155 [Diploscapter pachys]|uniref:Uncharacterized protein n=1 Tax=Diploscapter pachys TaxID=2018661 RepID=A0A2A2KHH2_9BILA|nr:hypothetical protein WR25_03155 [Diploscapter pachys]
MGIGLEQQLDAIGVIGGGEGEPAVLAHGDVVPGLEAQDMVALRGTTGTQRGHHLAAQAQGQGEAVQVRARGGKVKGEALIGSGAPGNGEEAVFATQFGESTQCWREGLAQALLGLVQRLSQLSQAQAEGVEALLAGDIAKRDQRVEQAMDGALAQATAHCEVVQACPTAFGAKEFEQAHGALQGLYLARVGGHGRSRCAMAAHCACNRRSVQAQRSARFDNVELRRFCGTNTASG